jgi:methyl-accepting chemotaxis protein
VDALRDETEQATDTAGPRSSGCGTGRWCGSRWRRGLAGLALALLAWWIRRSLIRALKRVGAVARRVAAGDLGAPQQQRRPTRSATHARVFDQDGR